MYEADFATREGMAQLKETLAQLGNMLTKQKKKNKLKQKIAVKMKEKRNAPGTD